MAFIAFLIGLGIVMEGVNQAHSYFAGPKASVSATHLVGCNRRQREQTAVIPDLAVSQRTRAGGCRHPACQSARPRSAWSAEWRKRPEQPPVIAIIIRPLAALL